MKKLFCLLFVISISSVLYAENATYSELKLKDSSSAIKIKVVTINKESLVYIDANNITQTVSNDQIDYIKNIDKNDSKFKKAIILTNKSYYVGMIVYQDRQKISLEIAGDLKSFKNENVLDVVNYEDFKDEQSRSYLKAMGFSVLFPGAGQFYSNRYTSGVVFGSIALLEGLATVYFYYDALSNWNKYKAGNYKSNATYNSYKMSVIYCNASAFLLATAYIYSIIDAGANFSYKYDILNNPPKSGISFYQTGKQDYVIAFNYLF